MSVIYKYPLASGEQEIKMPPLESIVSAGPDSEGIPCLWAQVDNTETTPVPYKVMVVMTGQDFDGSAWTHCKTWITGPLVFHLLVPVSAS